MTPELLLAAVGSIFVALFAVGLLLPPPDPVRALRKRYRELSRLSRAEAWQQLDRRVEELSARYPGHDYLWYVRWLVRDLERAKQ